METKKTLRRRLEEAEGRIAELDEYNREAAAGLDTLEDLGYESFETEDPIFGWKRTTWRLTGAQSAKNAARDAELAEHLDRQKADARELGRREALALVIEALEIPGYRPDAFRALLKNPGPLDHLDRFHADLTTAVEVRRDIAAASERGKVEKKVADLSKRESKNWATGGLIPGTSVPHLHMSGSQLVDSIAYALDSMHPLSKAGAARAAAAAAKTVDHDVATAGEKVENAA